MKDVEAFVSVEKSPTSGIVKGYKFFVKGFIHEFQGLVMSVLISFLAFSLVDNACQREQSSCF